jgi:predicted transcriptional regulator
MLTKTTTKQLLNEINMSAQRAIKLAPLGLTIDELSLAIQLPKCVCEKSVAMLSECGIILDTGVRRKTREGSDTIVYKIAHKNGTESEAQCGKIRDT